MAESSAAGLAEGELLDGRYRLMRRIGSGGMATVWRARDERLGRTVAVKVISDALAADPVWCARFAREARTAAAISHPHLIAVYDYGSGPGRPYLVMEHLEGGTLAELAARRPLAPAEVRRLACELLSALAQVHDAGVLHRDVKPANVLLDSHGRARLTDFGIARHQDATAITQPGQLLGTLHYLAPELVRGAPPSPASDLYSLGVLLDELPVAGALDQELRGLIAALRAPAPQRRPAGARMALARLAHDPDGVPAAEISPTGAVAGRRAFASPRALARTVVLPRTLARRIASARTLGWAPMRSPLRLARGRLLATGTLAAAALVVVVFALTAPGGGRQASASIARHRAMGASTTARRVATDGRSASGRRSRAQAHRHAQSPASRLVGLLDGLERSVKQDGGG
jgi:hypothetical protein